MIIPSLEKSQHTLLGNLFERFIYCEYLLRTSLTLPLKTFDDCRIPHSMRRYAEYEKKLYLLSTLRTASFKKKDAEVSGWAKRVLNGKISERPKSITRFMDLRKEGIGFTIFGMPKMATKGGIG